MVIHRDLVVLQPRLHAEIRSWRQDFGENDIFPEPDEEVLKASGQLSETRLPKENNASPTALPGEAMASIDTEASPVLHERIGVALKGVKAAGKGVARGAQTLARGAKNVARRGIDYVVKGGKVLLRGAGPEIARGAKRLRDIGARLLQRTRFKGFRIRIRGRRFIIEGRINPWVKIVEGELAEVPEGTPGAQWVDDDVWATGRLQRNFNKPRKSFADVDEAKRAKEARKQTRAGRSTTGQYDQEAGGTWPRPQGPWISNQAR